MPRVYTSKPLEDRFWAKVDFSGECWEWTAARTRSGYGNFMTVPHQTWVPAHRVSYELLRGCIPEGLVLDHLCENRGCVNPWHVQVTTHRVNILRGNSLSARRARMTECKYGHPLTPSNTHIKGNGHRRCRVCMTAQLQRYIDKKRAHPWSCKP